MIDELIAVSTSVPHFASQILDPMTFPLHGARLIEASAGTGKTYTIASLYLRLLLQHGQAGSGHGEELSVDRILVVTFTEAATAELRDRIRSKIHDAYLAFSRKKANEDDGFMIALLADIPEHRYLEMAKILLQAERQMDEAAIYTIHGFCQRMLTQNAFESGVRFNNEFVTDESELKRQVVADFWRRHFYSISPQLAEDVQQIWSSPKQLLETIGGFLTGPEVAFSVPALQGDLSDAYRTRIDQIDALKALWREVSDDIQPMIANSGVDKRSYSKKNLPTWFHVINDWAYASSTNLQLPDKLDKFSQQILDEKTKKGTPPSHAVFTQIDELLVLSDFSAPLTVYAIEHCRQALFESKLKKGWLSFDDLLTQFSSAIEQDSDHILKDRIRALYPVAMIDEFQDTDPLQYHIFSEIYVSQPQCALLMIGDPKQAIYAFRGADIFTYIQARRQVTDHYTLQTNWRSCPDVVSAVNGVFKHGTAPFIYDADIPFLPVSYSANNAEKSWWMDQQKQTALTAWLPECDEAMSGTDYENQMANATAAQIQTILTKSEQGTAYFKKSALGEPIEIKAGNMAVLVRTGKEGKLVRQALAKQGIASVYLSNRDSIFEGKTAKDMLRLLQAVFSPEDESTLRAALASSLFGLTAAQLDALNNDEIAWEREVNQFKDSRDVWAKRGVMPMLRQILSRQRLAQQWLAEEEGERRLTDVLHLGELLQEASQILDSDYALLRWLAEHIDNPNQNADEQILRLESERNLVQVITIHKSKGLEYDLVFLPFLCRYRAVTKKYTVKYHDESRGQAMVDVEKLEDNVELADKERLAEDIRLLYVGLTRAVYGLYLGLAPVKDGQKKGSTTGLHHSAIGYLLQKGEAGDINDLIERVNSLAQTLTGDVMMVTVPPELPDMGYQGKEGALPTVDALREFNGKVDNQWWMTSYSNLVKQGHQSVHNSHLELPGFDIDSEQDKTDVSDDSDIEISADPERSIFTFPKGARPGTFLHTVFEEIDFTLPADSDSTTACLTTLLIQENYELEWLPVLQTLIDHVLNCPLDGQGLRLSEKQAHQKLTEMEFLLPIQALSASKVNRVVAQHDDVSAQAGTLGFQTVSGMLKGFIDLIFEHEGRYYVLDWKSNHLGDSPDDYGSEALIHAMRDHRYDWQYQLYALALHRFLQTRIADYDYERHFGGVYYLFLRGVTTDGHRGIFSAKPSLAFLTELEQIIDGEV